jgi:aminoglycoside phosphotransferase (APT) family kinase protein
VSAVSPEALRDWVGAETGGEVLDWRRLVSGNSRTTFAADVRVDGDVVPLVVRHEEGGGPVAGTELSLEREAVVYRALQDRGLPIPRLYGESDALRAIALTRMPGTADEPTRALPDLLVRLAQLHRLPVGELDLPGFAGSALADLELWASIADRKIAHPDELVGLAFEVLRGLFPGEPERLVLCHGDAGEGNFLAQSDRVSGILDWEFAHFGDPHDDLASITVRALMYGHRTDGFGTLVRERYAEGAGVTLSPGRLRYWQVVVVLRILICCLSVAQDVQRNRDPFVHLILLPGLRHRLAHMLAALAGVAVDLPDPLPPGIEAPGSALLEAVVAGLGDLYDAIPEPEPRQRAKAMRRLLSHFSHTWSQAPEVASINAAERSRAGSDRASRLRCLVRAADRELALLPRLSPIAGTPLAGLED